MRSPALFPLLQMPHPRPLARSFPLRDFFFARIFENSRQVTVDAGRRRPNQVQGFISRLSSCYAMWKGSLKSPTSSTSHESVCVSRPVVPAPFLSLFSLGREYTRDRVRLPDSTRLEKCPSFPNPLHILDPVIRLLPSVTRSTLEIDHVESATSPSFGVAALKSGPVKAAAHARGDPSRGPFRNPSLLSPGRRSGGVLEFRTPARSRDARF